MWRVVTALILAVSLWIITPLPAAGQSLGEYFQINYEPVSFSKNEIHGSETIYATIRGQAKCTKDLPMPVSEASITSRMVAEDSASGMGVTLNSSYTITIKPFPSKQGDTIEINQVVPLQFPAQAKSGNYNVIMEFVEAKVKVGFVWLDVSSYLPQAQPVASVEYIAPELTPPPSTPPPPTPPAPQAPAPKPEIAPVPAPTPIQPPSSMTWWVWLIVAVAIITTVVSIIWYMQHRKTR